MGFFRKLKKAMVAARMVDSVFDLGISDELDKAQQVEQLVKTGMQLDKAKTAVKDSVEQAVVDFKETMSEPDEETTVPYLDQDPVKGFRRFW